MWCVPSILAAMSAVIHLQALGLTEYEARAYTALLALGRSVPARIARQANIPRPKIYETLERLEGRGLAAKVEQNPLAYAPLSAREYLSRSRRSFEDRLAALDRDLSRLTPDPAPEAVYHLSHRAAILSLCEDLVLNARQYICIAGDAMLTERLKNLLPRGVAIRSAVIGHLPSITETGEHAFLLTRDGEAALIAHFVDGYTTDTHTADTHLVGQMTTQLLDQQSGMRDDTHRTQEAHGVHTHNPVIIHLIEGHIRLAAQMVTQTQA